MTVLGALPTLSAQTAYLALGHLPPYMKKRGVLWLLPTEREVERALTLWPFFNEKLPCRWPQDAPEIYTSEPEIIITSETMVSAPVLSRAGFKNLSLSIKKGDRFQISRLKKHLVNTGYVQEATANRPGTFTSRGSLLDVWPPHLHQPMRLDFAEDVIASISEFDWITLSKIRSIKTADLIPTKVDGADGTLIDLIGDAAILTTNEAIVKETDQAILLSPFTSRVEPEDQIITHTIESRRQAMQNATPGYRVIVSTTHPDKTSDLFEDAQNIPAIPGLGSFASPTMELLFVTDEELYPRAKTPVKRKERKDFQEFVASLEPGSFVVHLFHGIAKYKGLTSMEVNAVEREYMVLEYAGKDRMFVPVEMSDRIDVYVGSPNPTINSLSDTKWAQTMVRSRKETLQMAEELLALYAQREILKAPAFGATTDLEKEVARDFPFDLTEDQEQAWMDVESDLERTTPTDRLIVGDVGFGKTEIALRAAVKAVANGYQAAILAPTTILVQQHLQTFQKRLKSSGITVKPLSRFESDADQKKTVKSLKEGQVDIVVGTHRLLSKDVSFDHLGLLIIDEEQRFGVKHKESLKDLKKNVHTLTLTATPIPRTLNLSLSGLRDLSTIATPPPGRIPIETVIAPMSEAQIKEAVTRELRRNGQVYYLFNQVRAIEGKAANLRKLFPQARIGVAHGQMPSSHLASIMDAFRQGDIDLLVCSTIVENGLDLPNVNTLIVEKAQSLGLGQLYQLRGRIGRGLRQAYAYFLYTSRELNKTARHRLKALEEARELGAGFELAMRDLEIRGAGAILGKEQSGRISEIGLHLYTKLLSQAVQELKTGKAPEPIRDINIDLPVDSRIPEDIVKEEKERLKLYQRLARSTTEEELESALMYAKQVWPRLEDKLDSLIFILRLRLLAQPTSITSIDTVYPSKKDTGVKQPRIVIHISEIPNEETEIDIRKFGGRRHENRIQLRLQDDWQDQLIQIINLLQK